MLFVFGVSFSSFFCNFLIGFWNCSDSVIFFVFVLLNVKKNDEKR